MRKYDDKFIEVLSEAVKNLTGPEGDNIEKVQRKMVENLVKKGYHVEEISEILEQIFKIINLNNENLKLRLVHPDEIQNLTDDAKEYFLYLKDMNIITEKEFEETLNDIMLFNNTIDIASLKNYLNQRSIYKETVLN